MRAAFFLVCLAIIAPVLGQSKGIGCWRIDDGRILKFREDKSAAVVNAGAVEAEGKWEEDPFTDKIRRFAVTWNNGQVFDVEISPDGSALRGTRKINVNGDGDITAKRVEEVKVLMWANDIGTLWVNGTQVMAAGLHKIEEGRIFIRSGDVISINVANKGGVMQLGFEAFKGTQKYLSAGEFHYTEAPEIDWQKTPKFALGYRRPLAQTKRNFVIGPVKDPSIGTPQKQDEKFRKLHFKYVVK